MQPSMRLHAAGAALLAVLLFSGLDALVKATTFGTPLAMVVFLRYAAGLIFSAGSAAAQGQLRPGWPTVRRAFGREWPDCRLGTTEHRLLGFARPADLPSAEVPAVWLHWLRHRDVGRLPAVLEHNRWDLVSLVALVPALSAAYAAL